MPMLKAGTSRLALHPLCCTASPFPPYALRRRRLDASLSNDTHLASRRRSKRAGVRKGKQVGPSAVMQGTV